MTDPPRSHTAADGTSWLYYDFILEPGSERRTRVPTGSERATHRAFKSGDGAVYCYRFSARWDYHEAPAKVLDEQIALAVAMREAGKENTQTMER